MKKFINLLHIISLILIAAASVIVLFVPSLNIWQKIAIYAGLTLVNDLLNFKTMLRIVDNVTGGDSLEEMKILLGLKKRPIVKERSLSDMLEWVMDPDGSYRLSIKSGLIHQVLTPEELMKELNVTDEDLKN